MSRATQPMAHMIRLFMVVALTFGLSSCGLFGSDKPPVKQESPLQEIEIKPSPEHAQINLLVTASPLTNPQTNGEPAPLILRLYQLSGQVPFVQANFRQLWEQDAETLGPTLLHKTQFIVQPGDVQKGVVPLAKGTLLLAATAGFRDFEHAKWRAIVPLQGKKQVALKIVLKTRSVNLVSHELGQFEEATEQSPADTATDAPADTETGAVPGSTPSQMQTPDDPLQAPDEQPPNNEHAPADANKGSDTRTTNGEQTDQTNTTTNPGKAVDNTHQQSSDTGSSNEQAPDQKRQSTDSRQQTYLQVGAFSGQDNARQVAARLRAMDSGIGNIVVEPAASNGATLYRVRVGPFTNTDHRRTVRRQLLREGFAVIRVQQQAQGEAG